MTAIPGRYERPWGNISVLHNLNIFSFCVSNKTKHQYVFDHTVNCMCIACNDSCLCFSVLFVCGHVADEDKGQKTRKGGKKKVRVKPKKGRNKRKIANRWGIKNDTQNEFFIWVTGLINFSVWSPKKPGVGWCQKNKCKRWKRGWGRMVECSNSEINQWLMWIDYVFDGC